MTIEGIILDIISRDERLDHVSERESYLGITPTDKRSMVYSWVKLGLIKFLNMYTEEIIESDWETTLLEYLEKASYDEAIEVYCYAKKFAIALIRVEDLKEEISDLVVFEDIIKYTEENM